MKLCSSTAAVEKGEPRVHREEVKRHLLQSLSVDGRKEGSWHSVMELLLPNRVPCSKHGMFVENP